ncbi:hypothetical protein F5Y16DRAFT_418671 [Xylariaceae sp. FL0255]|nr:hypothetical protein F5Y16DRAFT_418671 [Xylariaceae sp. FL0255]
MSNSSDPIDSPMRSSSQIPAEDLAARSDSPVPPAPGSLTQSQYPNGSNGRGKMRSSDQQESTAKRLQWKVSSCENDMLVLGEDNFFIISPDIGERLDENDPLATINLHRDPFTEGINLIDFYDRTVWKIDVHLADTLCQIKPRWKASEASEPELEGESIVREPLEANLNSGLAAASTTLARKLLSHGVSAEGDDGWKPFLEGIIHGHNPQQHHSDVSDRTELELAARRLQRSVQQLVTTINTTSTRASPTNPLLESTRRRTAANLNDDLGLAARVRRSVLENAYDESTFRSSPEAVFDFLARSSNSQNRTQAASRPRGSRVRRSDRPSSESLHNQSGEQPTHRPRLPSSIVHRITQVAQSRSGQTRPLGSIGSRSYVHPSQSSSARSLHQSGRPPRPQSIPIRQRSNQIRPSRNTAQDRPDQQSTSFYGSTNIWVNNDGSGSTE